MVPKKRDGTNIASAIMILSYTLFTVWFKIIFSSDSDVGFVLGFLIFIGIVAGCIAYYTNALHDATPQLVKSIDSFLDFLSPENPDDAFSLLKTCAVSGAILLSFSLFGPWFVMEGNWEHEFDSYYSTEYGKGFNSRYGLSGVMAVTYDYYDWGEYDTDREYTGYEGVNGFLIRTII